MCMFPAFWILDVSSISSGAECSADEIHDEIHIEHNLEKMM